MKKKLGGPEFGPKGSKAVKNLVFLCHFFKFGSVVFLEIAYNDSLQQCVIFCKSKTLKKVFWEGRQIWAKIGPETRFLIILSSLLHWLSLKLHTVIVCKDV